MNFIIYVLASSFGTIIGASLICIVLISAYRSIQKKRVDSIKNTFGGDFSEE